MDRFIENEVNALSNSLKAVQSLLDQWKQNEERGLSLAIPAQSVGTMKEHVNGIRGRLDAINETFDGTDE